MDEVIARIGTRAKLIELQALWIIESSEADPDVTEWDDDLTARRKLERKAERANQQR